VGPRRHLARVSLLRMSPINGLGLQWQADYDPASVELWIVRYRWITAGRSTFVSAGNNEVHNNPALAPAANQFQVRTGFGDPNHRGWNAAVTGVLRLPQRPYPVFHRPGDL